MNVEFERYEVWSHDALNEPRKLRKTFGSLAAAMTFGQTLTEFYINIDYIALTDRGRTEMFWVWHVDKHVWVQVGGD